MRIAKWGTDRDANDDQLKEMKNVEQQLTDSTSHDTSDVGCNIEDM